MHNMTFSGIVSFPIVYLLLGWILQGTLAFAAATDPWDRLDTSKLKLRSEVVLVADTEGNRIYGKNTDRLMPIASITKLMTAEEWNIGLSKTGYINESGRCLVMEANLLGRTLHIVLLNSFGKLTPFGDSNRLRKWVSSELCDLTSQRSAANAQHGCWAGGISHGRVNTPIP